ncbi:flavin reductase family protein [Croceibacterium sp. LX-88]|uniref:Flavin reductase family protein n=1 Tax=Croceibacterium selenioxidans TaxID=2838833 RepID=A0ABS5W4E3_9SPHN|nr:flavin reductase family protein [Croceibacterium selenioxidans]MBT2134197.1 flavin reductase family protein [Croceibacterium selenioxidans]
MPLDKRDFPLIDIRRHLETGPIVLVTSQWQGQSNIMTMGWHSMMQFSPALVGCYIWEGNRSHAMIHAARECVINVPTEDLADQVVQIGNSHADAGDKFAATGLTSVTASRVGAPLIAECYASFECKLFDDQLVHDYSFFIWEVVKAHVADIVAPRTIHYRGQGTFMVAGKELDFRARFKSQNL